MTDIKKPPYFSTFDEAQKYYRILARPGRPIQAREWNDLQEQIQKQIERVGAHLFKNGAQILPGSSDSVTYRNNIGFIKLSAETSPTTEQEIKNLWLGKTVVSTSGAAGLKAKVIGYRVTDTLDEVRLFIDYTQADETDGTSLKFAPGQNLATEEAVPSTATVSNLTTSVGTVSGVFVKQSVYFFNGDFILTDEQAVFLDPADPKIQGSWNNRPTAKVGLSIERSIVTFEQDESLGDNASPSDSFGAPGADRLCIIAKLESRDYEDQNDGQFIELLRVSNGVVQERVQRTDYAVLADTLARRTYDESGDYTVRNFPIDVRPFLLEGDNKGVRTKGELKFETEAEARAAAIAIFGIDAACRDTDDPDTEGKWLPATSYGNFLQLARSKLTLQIDPGKAYVKGYEIEKLAPSYVDIDKARDLRFHNNRTVSTNLGAYIYVTNVYGPPEVSNYELIQIHKVRKFPQSPGQTSNNDITALADTLLGTARVLAIEYFSGTHGDPGAVYKLYLFDIKASPGVDLSQMKKVVSTSGLSFSADISLQFSPLQGSVTVGTPATTLVGNGTSFLNKTSQKISPNDYIRVGNSDSHIYRVSSVQSDTGLTLTSTATFSGNQAIEFAYTSFHGLEDENGLVFPLPESFAYTIRGANADNSPNSVIDTNFSVRRVFETSSDDDGVITLAITDLNEEFSLYSPNDYIVVNTDTSDWLRLAAGSSPDEENSTAGVEVVSPIRVKIHTSSPLNNFYVISTILKRGGDASREKTKTAIQGKFISGSYSGEFVETAVNKSDLGLIQLTKADVFKVTRIVMSPDFTTAPSSLEVLPAGHKDITDRFELDDGQTEYYYGIASVYLKPGAERPSGRVRVEFDYFDHSPDGSYFSVDSYPFKNDDPTKISIDYADIPKFKDSSGRIYELRDCIDFRPLVSNSGQFAALEVPRSNVTLDFHHYLHRVDNLYLDRFGYFRVMKGVPDLLPVAPEEPGDAMSLCDLDLQAYTATPSQCYLRRKDNRRYTMRDIGKIEARVSNLEYYTLLSLLEKEAKELDVKDADGFDRFKNGFIVDNFADHENGHLGNRDHRCSVDPEAQELRPALCQKHVDLIETNGLIPSEVTKKQARDDNNYALTGKLYTLAYSTVPFIEQDLASQVENVNPYAKFTFKGRLGLDPSTDSWRDTETLPKLTVVDDTAYRAAVAGINPKEVIWGEWKSHTKQDVTVKNLPEYSVLGRNKPDAQHAHNWPRYVHKPTETTTTVTTKKVRKGFSEKVVPGDLKTESLGKRIVSVVAASYMREKSIKVEGRGFLPKAVLYPFFDGEPVGQYCQPHVGGVLQPLGSVIRADDSGSVDLTFKLPKGKFLTGERIFKLTTSAKNEINPQPASDGEAKYYAIGWIDTVQETELSIRQFEVQRVQQTQRDVDTASTTVVTETVEREDPIAQSFAVLEKGGCFLVAVDVFFFSKDPKIPIKLQIRPLSNDGYPTNQIMPFGEVVKDAKDVITNVVDLKTSMITIRGEGNEPGYTAPPWRKTASGSGADLLKEVSNKSGRDVIDNNEFRISAAGAHVDMIPTRFIFKSPVFLQENNDYAIVLLADSIEYQAWVSQAGPITPRPGGTPVFGSDINSIIGTNTKILKDNFINGVFFRSSNGRTWNADQLIDMKFALHKAKFVTNTTGTIEYVNDNIPVAELVSDPIVTKAGSTKIRVLHKNHGHPAFSAVPPRVVLSGVVNANGIDQNVLNRAIGWPIQSIEIDSYVIDVGLVAASSGRCGGNQVTASQNVSMDTIFLNTHQLTFPDSDLKWSCQTTNGGGVSYYDPKAVPFSINPFKEIQTNTTWDFPNPMTVSSSINENKRGEIVEGPSMAIITANGVADRKSLRVKAELKTTNENVSPVLDLDRLSAIAIANRINNPNGSGAYNINVDGLDTLQIIPTSVVPAVLAQDTASKIYFYADTSGVNKGRIGTDDANIAQHLSKLDVGKLVTISGTSGGARNKTNVKVIEVTYTPATTPKCSVVFDTTFSGTSSLDSGQVSITQLDNFVDEIAPGAGSAAFKYVTKQLTLARQSTALKISFDANRDISNEIELFYKTLRTDSRVPFEDLNWVKAEFNLERAGTLSPAYPAPNTSESEFTEYSATINNLPAFVGFAIKIVGKGGNSSRPPRIQNLMGIAIDE